MRSTLSPYTDNPGDLPDRDSGCKLAAPISTLDDALLKSKDTQAIRARTQEILKHVPLVVFAEDREEIQRSSIRIFKSAHGFEDLVALHGPTEENFETLEDLEPRKLPLLVCQSGEETERALQEILKRDYQRGLLAVDDQMAPGKSGQRLIQEYGEHLPSTWARIIQTGNPLIDATPELQSGVLDARTDKFTYEALYTLVNAYATRFNRALAEYAKNGK